LGGFTVGKGARIGSNAVVLAAVAPGVTMVGIPARVVGQRPAQPKPDAFLPYGTPCDDLPDPVARALGGLLEEVTSLRARVSELEARPATSASGEFIVAEANGNGRVVAK
jgi:serine O-acetyltransferase